MYVKVVMFACLAFFTQPVLAENFVEGVHYTALDIPKSKQKEIREFFSFYCRNCYSQEPFMKDLEKNMPGRAKFIKNHVEGMPNRNSNIEALLSKALIVSERMRIKDKVVAAIFKKIHINKGDFTSPEEIKALFMSFGVSEIMYDSTASSFTVDIKHSEMKQKTGALRAQKITTVPVLIVNGKYQPNSTRITSMQEYKELLYYLLNK